MKPAARGLGGALLFIGAVAVAMLVIVRKGPYGALLVVGMVGVLLCVVTALAVVFGKRKKNG